VTSGKARENPVPQGDDNRRLAGQGVRELADRVMRNR
jgi:hypothetical protein